MFAPTKIGCTLALVILGFVVSGCGKSDKLLTNTNNYLSGDDVISAEAVMTPYNIKAKANLVEISVENSVGAPNSDIAATVFCADWGQGKFVDKVEGGGIWKRERTYLVVSMPEAIADKQACGMTWETYDESPYRPTKHMIAGFFNPADGREYTVQEQRRQAKLYKKN